MEHSFNTNIAKEYDVYTAILLNNLKFWTLNNLANQKKIHDGLCWTYNTIQAFCDIFPYWTRHQLEHLLSKCEKNGLIISGNYNDHKYDRKKWYALTAKAYRLFPELGQEHFITYLWDSISEKTEMSKLHPDISGNSELSFGRFREAFLQNPKPIADINTDEKPNDNPIGENENSLNPEKQTPPKESKPSKFTVKVMVENNPHEIPESMLSDWMDIRKAKRNNVTATAWNRVNRNLTEIYKKTGITPIDAFETMVAAGWQSLELKYFENNSKGTAKQSQGSGIKDSSGNDVFWD